MPRRHALAQPLRHGLPFSFCPFVQMAVFGYIKFIQNITEGGQDLPTPCIAIFDTLQTRTEALESLRRAKKDNDSLFLGCRLPNSQEQTQKIYWGKRYGQEFLIFPAVTISPDPSTRSETKKFLKLPRFQSTGEAMDWLTIRGWRALEMEAEDSSRYP
ncbi:MAG: hypothetical protein M1383_02430 [Patescibacteria group bacterium]|nr:hypothetical protein [Patescibacteria group bacterium]